MAEMLQLNKAKILNQKLWLQMTFMLKELVGLHLVKSMV